MPRTLDFKLYDSNNEKNKTATKCNKDDNNCIVYYAFLIHMYMYMLIN